MKIDIILAGVGGQGIISIASVIGFAALQQGLFMKQSEVHGMSQRGGNVQSNLRISDREIASDLIPQGKADIIISVEPLESLRYLPGLSQDGWVITSTTPFINIPDYPPIDTILKAIKSLPHYIALDADAIARNAGSVKAANIVILGAASPFLDMAFQQLEDAIRIIFRKKGEEITTINLKALQAGRDFADRKMQN
jgi:indolepyruvate ferredoxin oxidoreductase, beta subunit